MRFFERAESFASRFHIDPEPGERVERFQNVTTDPFAGGELVREEAPRSVRRFDERQRVFADFVIPIRMRDPFHVELVLKTKWKLNFRSTLELIENHAVVNPLDARLSPIAIVKQFAAALFNFGHADRSNPKKKLGRGEIDSRFLFLRFDLKQNDVLRS